MVWSVLSLIWVTFSTVQYGGAEKEQQESRRGQDKVERRGEGRGVRGRRGVAA